MSIRTFGEDFLKSTACSSYPASLQKAIKGSYKKYCENVEAFVISVQPLTKRPYFKRGPAAAQLKHTMQLSHNGTVELWMTNR